MWHPCSTHVCRYTISPTSKRGIYHVMVALAWFPVNSDCGKRFWWSKVCPGAAFCAGYTAHASSFMIHNIDSNNSDVTLTFVTLLGHPLASILFENLSSYYANVIVIIFLVFFQCQTSIIAITVYATSIA